MPRKPPYRAASLLWILGLVLSITNCGGGGSASQNSGSQPVLAKLNVTPQNPGIPLGGSVQLKATAVYSDGTNQDVTGSAAWKSSDPGIATVDATGYVNGNGVGTAQISAQYESVSANDAVSVSPAVLLSIAVTPTSSSLPVGESEPMTATGSYSDGSTQDLTSSATWNSSQPSIASVNASGDTLAIALGNATITATSGNISGQAQVVVTSAVPVALNIIPSAVSLVLGGSRQLQAVATYSDGTNQDVTGLVQWSSIPSNIVSVSSGGLSTGVQVGSATIFAVESTLDADAGATVSPLALVSYFDLASAQASNTDGTVYITQPDSTSGNLCSLIYVFDQNQELSECCGCSTSDGGLRTLSLVTDLTSNPLTGVSPKTGVIKIVPSEPSQGQCNPSLPSTNGVLMSWITNVQKLGATESQLTEVEFTPVLLPNGEESRLANLCGAIQTLGGGQGICTCGTGN